MNEEPACVTCQKERPELFFAWTDPRWDYYTFYPPHRYEPCDVEGCTRRHCGVCWAAPECCRHTT